MLFSIITPTYNSAKTIEACINSVSNQCYKEIEHIIIDGASSDRTMEIIEKYRENISQVVSEPDNGIYDAMNKGIKLAEGEVVGILNSDDVYINEHVIEKVVETFKREQCDVVYGNINFVSDKGEVIRFWKAGTYIPGSFMKGWHPPHPAFFVKKEVYTRLGSFRTDMSMAADFEFMLRIMEKERTEAVYLDEVLVKMRYGGSTTGSIKNIVAGNRQCIRSFKENGLKPPHFYTIKRILPKIKQYTRRSVE